MTKEEFAPEMTWFAQFYEKQLSAVQTDVWFNCFKRYSVEEFSRALKAHIRSDLYNGLPAPGKIRAIIEADDNSDFGSVAFS